jgi:hypothetical protein
MRVYFFSHSSFELRKKINSGNASYYSLKKTLIIPHTVHKILGKHTLGCLRGRWEDNINIDLM